MRTGSSKSESSRNVDEDSFDAKVKNDAKEHLDHNTLTDHPDTARYIRHMALQKNGNVWLWQRLWLRHCLSTQTRLLFYNLEGEGIDVDREGDINSILQKGFLEATELRDPIKKYYKQGIADWFLRRYNWPDALRVSFSLPPPRARNIYRAIVISIVILLLVLTVALVSAYCFPILNRTPWPLPTFWAVVVLVAVVILPMLLTGWHRFLFIRLLVTIMMGFVPVVVEDSLWKLAVEMEWPMLAIVPSVTFAFALAYCTADCARVSSLPRLSALRRALPVALYGILIAFVMAIMLSYVMGASMIDGIHAQPLVSYPGVHGTVYPAAVFLFAPVSLLIGLFLYSFWQEKTVTDPF